jgi:hypothetical protein
MAKRRLDLRPRIVNDADLAAYLGKSVGWLADHRHRLEAQGFPPRLPVVGGNDLEKVDQWLDRLPTNGGSTTNVDELWQRATGQCLTKIEQMGIAWIDFDRELAVGAAALLLPTAPWGLSLGDRACLALARLRNLPAVTADRA